MFAKTLIKLIDYAVFPAVLIVAAKIIGIVFIARYFGADYQVEGLGLSFFNSQEFLAVNSYSSLLMFAAVVGGLIWVVVKAHIFHDTHLKPSLSAHLHNLDLTELVNTNQTIFSQSFIWLSYAWLTTAVFGVQAYFGLSLWSIFWIGLVVSVIATVLLVVDLEREILEDESEVSSGSSKTTVLTLKELNSDLLI